MSTVAPAQVKTDGEWRGVGGAAFAATSGNTSSNSALLNLDLVRATERDKITLGAMANYARSKNAAGVTETTADKWGGFGQYDYNLTPRVYVFGKLGLEGDRLVDLNLRTALAGGAGYKLVDTPETAFSVFTGLGYTTDKYGVTQTIDGSTGTRFSRASVLLGEESSHQLSPTVTLKQRLEVSPGFTGDRAVLAKFTAGLGVAMNSTLSLNVGLTDTYNSKPPAGFKRNDIGVFTGINVKFGAE
jgi:putative salt-induced outer membrane protein